MDINQKQNSTTENQTPSSVSTGVGAFVWDLVKILIIALVIIVPFRKFVAEPFVVSGSSMLPNYHNNDYLIVDRFSYITGKPSRGDVIVLNYPKDPTQYYIKRIIGLPGDTVTVSAGFVTITNTQHPDGFRLTEPYLTSQTETIGKSDPVHLGSEEYYVLGDNRTASSDSRVWGILPANDIVGRVWARVYPFSDSGLIKTPGY